MTTKREMHAALRAMGFKYVIATDCWERSRDGAVLAYSAMDDLRERPGVLGRVLNVMRSAKGCRIDSDGAVTAA